MQAVPANQPAATRKRRRRALPAVVGLAAAALLTGCLVDPGDIRSNDNTSNDIEIMLGFTGAQFDSFRESVDPYARSQGIIIRWAPTSNFNQLINTRVQGNNLPDIALFPQPGVMRNLAERGNLTPLDDVLDLEELRSGMTSGTLEAGTLNGQLYGLLVSMNVKSLVFYPKQDFAAAGYQEPQSLDELLALTDRIRTDGSTPWCLGIESGAATGWPATDWLEDLVLQQQGVETYNRWVEHDLDFDSAPVREAAEVFAQIAFTEGNVLGGRSSIAANNFGTAANPMFTSPAGCFLYKQGNFVAAPGGFPDQVIADIDSRVGVFGFPPATEGGESPVLGGGDLATLFSPNNEAAKKILRFMSSRDFGADNAGAGNYISPRQDFDLANYPNQVVRDAATVAYESTSFVFDGSDQMPGAVGSGSFWKEMTAWISGQQSLTDSLQAIDSSWPET